MNNLSIDYNGLEDLLNSLSRLSFKPSNGCIDTWDVIQEDCTTCKNAIKHEQFNKGAKVVMTDGCKVPDNFITNSDKPIKCEHYTA